MRRASLRSTLLLATLAAPALASAQPAQPAQPAQRPSHEESEYARGAELREQRRDDAALELFRALHERTQQPRALAQMALTEDALGRWVDAERHLIEALTALRDPWIARNRATLTASLSAMRAHIGTLVVTCDVPQAEVWIAGQRAGSVGAPLHVLAGELSFEVRADGRTTTTVTTTVAANEVAREDVFLPLSLRSTPVASPATAPSAPGVEAPPGAPSLIVSSPPQVPSPEPRPRSTARALGWVGIGTGVALVAGGVAAWFLGRSAADAYNNDASCPGVGAPRQSDTCASSQSLAETLEPLAWTSVGVGAALTLAGAVLVGTSGRTTAPRSASSGCSVGVGTAPGVTCRVIF